MTYGVVVISSANRQIKLNGNKGKSENQLLIIDSSDQILHSVEIDLPKFSEIAKYFFVLHVILHV